MKSNSILLGAAIYKHLNEDDEIIKKIDGRIFPITVTNPDTPMPFVVYSRTSIVPEYAKDNLVSEVVNMDFVVVSRDYTESVEVAAALRNSLELKSGMVDDIIIRRIELDTVEENWYANTYWQILKFKFYI